MKPQWKKWLTRHRRPVPDILRDVEEEPGLGRLSDWDEASLRDYFKLSADIVVQSYVYGERGDKKIVLVFCEGLASRTQITDFVLPALDEVMNREEEPARIAAELKNKLQLSEATSDREWMRRLLSGELIVRLSGADLMYTLHICDVPQRAPEESTTEISIKGPRDGFTEELATNVALVRKRLRTTKLHNEVFVIGTESQTAVSLLYLQGVTKPDLVEEARRRLNHFEIDALLSSAQLEEGISDSSYSLFPLLDYIGRPDFIAQVLLKGRLAILVDGSPMALIAPTNMTAQLKSPEDLHFPFYFVTFEVFLRVTGLLVSILTPGFLIALISYNIDQLPFPLMATISNSRSGLPLSAPMEIILMLMLFEIFREAGLRLAKGLGQTVAVVGGLIIGDAAIRAGLTSPTMLFVAAATGVSTFILVNQSLSGTVSLMRLFTLLCSSLLGMFGFFISMFTIVIYLSGLRSFGVGYLEPLSPVSFRDLIPALMKPPLKKQREIPNMLSKDPHPDQEGNRS
ncbi:spore germination protein [Paenibacillus sp. GCM10012303]|uniref:spore germination protein n=1 Tax=Paenibacillus sp. GCM10012303 TaxID=3317340 RepID=UPI00361D6656